jgi:hypothetical protein
MRARTVLAACCLALLSATLTFADAWNRSVEFTFDKPVSIPAVHQPGWGVLPPGTYVFKIFDSAADRHIVQIFNKNETEIYATVLAIPNLRLKVTDKTVITFSETPVGQPFALRAIFYPGRAWGEEFVYPKIKALALAKVAELPVLSMPMQKEVSAMPEAPEIVAELENTPLTAIEPGGEEVQTEEVVTLPEIAAAGPPVVLPKTASPIPLLGVFGLLAIAGGLALGLAETKPR